MENTCVNTIIQDFQHIGFICTSVSQKSVYINKDWNEHYLLFLGFR